MAEKETKKIDIEDLADVSGGDGNGWFGRDEAPDGHDIGCITGLWYDCARAYCPVHGGKHQFTGRTRTGKSNGVNYKYVYCKCGEYEIFKVINVGIGRETYKLVGYSYENK